MLEAKKKYSEYTALSKANIKDQWLICWLGAVLNKKQYKKENTIGMGWGVAAWCLYIGKLQ